MEQNLFTRILRPDPTLLCVYIFSELIQLVPQLLMAQRSKDVEEEGRSGQRRKKARRVCSQRGIVAFTERLSLESVIILLLYQILIPKITLPLTSRYFICYWRVVS